MRSVNNAAAVDTINAAASAIVSAESRVQPNAVSKRRWRSFWNLYWCFGSQKGSKRIGHAVFVPEPETSPTVPPTVERRSHTTTVALPFIAPPSSPASFLQSEPPSAVQSPACVLSLGSLSFNAYSPGGAASMFTIGPYAHETQLVTPPVFSAFPTEPSTAPFTPPPESVHMTTPSSPEVPFAQLVTSSLERASKNGATYFKFGQLNGDFHTYQLYPGSPGGQLLSPGSMISNSGASSPFPDKLPMLDFRLCESQKILGLEQLRNSTWGSRLSSECGTPDGLSFYSGSVTPEGVRSVLGLRSPIPELAGLDDEISSVSEQGNGEPKCDEAVIDHRVSFALSGDSVFHCPERKSVLSNDAASEENSEGTVNSYIAPIGKASDAQENRSGEVEDICYKKQHSLTFRSIKEFNFDNLNEEGDAGKPTNIGSEWWANETLSGKESKPSSNWNFFRLRHPEVI